jgi:hypothetical protein
MPKIRVDLEATVINGQALTFKSPADCSQITGLIIYYPVGDSTTSKTFQFADAHGNNVGGKSLFANDVLVKVLLDTELNRAYVQNADTNAYLEGKLAEKYSPDNKPSPADIGAAKSSHKHTKSEITDFPTSMTPTAHTHTKSQITDFPTTETWTFTLEDGSTVTKAVYVG